MKANLHFNCVNFSASCQKIFILYCLCAFQSKLLIFLASTLLLKMLWMSYESYWGFTLLDKSHILWSLQDKQFSALGFFWECWGATAFLRRSLLVGLRDSEQEFCLNADYIGGTFNALPGHFPRSGWQQCCWPFFHYIIRILFITTSNSISLMEHRLSPSPLEDGRGSTKLYQNAVGLSFESFQLLPAARFQNHSHSLGFSHSGTPVSKIYASYILLQYKWVQNSVASNSKHRSSVSAGQAVSGWLQWVVMAQGVCWGCHLYTGLGWSHLKAWMGLEDLLLSCLTYVPGELALAVWNTSMAWQPSFLSTWFRRAAPAAMCFMASSPPVTSMMSSRSYVLAVIVEGDHTRVWIQEANSPPHQHRPMMGVTREAGQHRFCGIQRDSSVDYGLPMRMVCFKDRPSNSY